jgi:hypothetical protein
MEELWSRENSVVIFSCVDGYRDRRFRESVTLTLVESWISSIVLVPAIVTIEPDVDKGG